MRKIFKIYPKQLEYSIQDSINNAKQRYEQLCSSDGLTTNDNRTYKMSDDDIAILYRQMSLNIETWYRDPETGAIVTVTPSEENCIPFSINFGKSTVVSLEDYVHQVKINNMTDDDIYDLNGYIYLDETTRYVINNPPIDLWFEIPRNSSVVTNYEVDITMGTEPVNVRFNGVKWIGMEPEFESEKRYLIYIDGTLGVSLEI